MQVRNFETTKANITFFIDELEYAIKDHLSEDVQLSFDERLYCAHNLLAILKEKVQLASLNFFLLSPSRTHTILKKIKMILTEFQNAFFAAFLAAYPTNEKYRRMLEDEQLSALDQLYSNIRYLFPYASHALAVSPAENKENLWEYSTPADLMQVCEQLQEYIADRQSEDDLSDESSVDFAALDSLGEIQSVSLPDDSDEKKNEQYQVKNDSYTKCAAILFAQRLTSFCNHTSQLTESRRKSCHF